MAIPERKDLRGANLEGANLEGANLEGAELKGANLEGAYGLSFDQLSKVKTLHDTKLDEELFIPLKKSTLPFLKNLITMNDRILQKFLSLLLISLFLGSSLIFSLLFSLIKV